MDDEPIAITRNLLTVEETAEYLGLERHETYDLVMTGQITSIGIGRNRLIAPAAIGAYLRSAIQP